MNDYELLYMINQHDDWAMEEMMVKSKRLIWAIIHRVSGELMATRAHQNDMFQEGCLGLSEALVCYREEMCVPFLPFAKTCIEREIRSLLRRHRGQNYGIIDQSLSFEMTISEDEGVYLADIIPDPRFTNNPAVMAVHEEVMSRLEHQELKLKNYEKSIFMLRQYGYSYREIASIMDCNEKQVDNTVQKVMRKLALSYDSGQ